jgi:LPS sulfotransferase NodH
MPDRAPDPSPLWSPETYDRYLAWALEQGTTPNGVFGAKLMWGYLDDFATLLDGIDGLAGLSVPAKLERAFGGLHYIRISREDKVRQAVSLWKAVQTQEWKAEGRETPEPFFSFRAIDHLVRQLAEHDTAWTGFFTGLGVEPLTITYEELAKAHEPVIRRCLDHLGVPCPDDLVAGPPELRIQADDRSEEWVARYIELAREPRTRRD